MHKLTALATAASLTLILGACVAGDEDIDSSSDRYEPEGFDPERGLEPPEADPNEPSEPQK
ncbi:hypothetical protein [Parasphingorhabdus cellanae]|uniref:Argininosuccinate lyase n=1 Tax=Parasphingorhabdus cellanae TaxID=2806553 RepID=A0ABX7T4S6_9SPHN|nr:hypothetical protein [Parasphingorhabdus cellanae]QTD55260.1 hypothetical protein J4G78_13675 [Parasphingorhabdus cellanae]